MKLVVGPREMTQKRVVKDAEVVKMEMKDGDLNQTMGKGVLSVEIKGIGKTTVLIQGQTKIGLQQAGKAEAEVDRVDKQDREEEEMDKLCPVLTPGVGGQSKTSQDCQCVCSVFEYQSPGCILYPQGQE